VKKFKTYTLFHDIQAETQALRLNESYQYQPRDYTHVMTRKRRSDEKFLTVEGKFQLGIIKKHFMRAVENIQKEGKINVLCLGCRDINEIEFFESIDDRINAIGIDLAPSNDNRVIQGNVETFTQSNGRSLQELIDFNSIDIVFSSHNLEHLSNPSLHFKNLLNLVRKDTVYYFILPCWCGEVGPTIGHPAFIHCTLDYDHYTPAAFKEFLDEITDSDSKILFTEIDFANPAVKDLYSCFKF